MFFILQEFLFAGKRQSLRLSAVGSCFWRRISLVCGWNFDGFTRAIDPISVVEKKEASGKKKSLGDLCRQKRTKGQVLPKKSEAVLYSTKESSEKIMWALFALISWHMPVSSFFSFFCCLYLRLAFVPKIRLLLSKSLLWVRARMAEAEEVCDPWGSKSRPQFLSTRSTLRLPDIEIEIYIQTLTKK